MPNVEQQIQKLFLPGVGKKPDWAQWTPTETLFGEYATRQSLPQLKPDY